RCPFSGYVRNTKTCCSSLYNIYGWSVWVRDYAFCLLCSSFVIIVHLNKKYYRIDRGRLMARRFHPRSTPTENIRIVVRFLPWKLLLLLPVLLIVAVPTFFFGTR